MLNFFQRLPLPKQLSLAVMISILLTAVGSLFIIGEIIIKEIDKVTNENLTRETGIVSQQLASEYQQILERTETLSKILVNEFSEMAVDTSQSVDIKGVQSPLATLDDETINLNFARVDKFTEITGATATVFIRKNDDFLRVSTSLRNLNQQRVFGTFLGKSHPGYQQLMRGEAYIGAAHLFGKNYMTKYQPVRKNNQTIAIIYIGVAYDDILAQITTNLEKMKIGEAGFVFLTDINQNEANLLIHPKHNKQNLYDIYPEYSDSLRQMSTNKFGLLQYQDTTQGGSEAIERKISYRFVDGWNWVVGLDVDANEQVDIIEETLIWLSIASLAS